MEEIELVAPIFYRHFNRCHADSSFSEELLVHLPVVTPDEWSHSTTESSRAVILKSVFAKLPEKSLRSFRLIIALFYLRVFVLC